MTIDELMAAYNANFDQDTFTGLPDSSPLARSTIGNITRMMEKTTVSSDSEGHKTIYAGGSGAAQSRSLNQILSSMVYQSGPGYFADFVGRLFQGFGSTRYICMA